MLDSTRQTSNYNSSVSCLSKLGSQKQVTILCVCLNGVGGACCTKPSPNFDIPCLAKTWDRKNTTELLTVYVMVNDRDFSNEPTSQKLRQTSTAET
jgi:hypothetical protein